MPVCLVLGAGASLANGLHFRSERSRETLPPLDTTFFETLAARRIPLGGALETYFRDFLGVEPTMATVRERRMEEVFADVFFDFAEAGGRGPAYKAYLALVNLYLRILRANTNWLAGPNRRGGPVGRLLDAAAAETEELVVVTFNHDLVIENEIQRRARLRPRWCLDQGYGTAGASLNVLGGRGRAPEGDFSTHADGLCDHGHPITVLKLHGSMNWRVRINTSEPSPNLLLGRASGSTTTHVLTSRALPGDEVYETIRKLPRPIRAGVAAVPKAARRRAG